MSGEVDNKQHIKANLDAIMTGKKIVPDNPNGAELKKMQAFVKKATIDFKKMSKAEQKKALAQVDKSIEKQATPKTIFDKVSDGATEWKDGFVNDYNKYGAIKMIPHRVNDGFESIDKVTFDQIKEPIKYYAKEVDKALDDGKNDGKLSVAEYAWNGLKGVGNVADAVLSTKGVEVALLTATTLGAAPALTPAFTAGTGIAGAAVTGKGIYDTATAKTDDEARNGMQTVGSGTFMMAGAVTASKASLQAAQKAGVATNYTPEMNPFEAFVENVKVAPKGIGVATGLSAPVVGAAIPKAAIKFESKPNTPECYVTTGKADGIVYEKDGELFVPNKWNADAPYKVSKGSVIMKYDTDDFAVCDPKIFAKTYVDDTGAYAVPKNLKPGEAMNFTKKAPGGFEIVPAGTKVQTLEGEAVVQPGQVKLYDVDGNPYVGDIEKSLLKRNVPTDAKSKEMFELLDTYKKAAAEPNANPKVLHQHLLDVINDEVKLKVPSDLNPWNISNAGVVDKLNSAQKFDLARLQNGDAELTVSEHISQGYGGATDVSANVNGQKLLISRDYGGFDANRTASNAIDNYKAMAQLSAENAKKVSSVISGGDYYGSMTNGQYALHMYDYNGHPTYEASTLLESMKKSIGAE